MINTSENAPRHYTHPLIFLLLVIPFGAVSGFLGVTIVYLLGRSGVDPVTIAVLTGLSFLPHTFKFLYAPLVDLTLKRKQWYVMACITSALGIALLGMVPATEAGLPWLRILVVVGNVATAFLSMAVESLMAYNTAPGELGRTAGWFQAGNLGGQRPGGRSGAGDCREHHAGLAARRRAGRCVPACGPCHFLHHRAGTASATAR